MLRRIQCCGSGSGIRCLLDPCPGSGMGKKSGSGMNNPNRISESLETTVWVIYLNSLMRIRDGKKFGSVIQDGKNS
jgi:hypothetical protein